MSFSINVQKRKVGVSEDLRGGGKIPAAVYGPQMSPLAVSLDYREFEKMYKEAGEASLIDCNVTGESNPVKVLIQDVQFDPVKGKIMHVDFRQIRMDAEMHATVELEFVGQSSIVKEQGGTLIKALEEVNVKCLPADLVNKIEVDLSVLKSYEDTIHIKDLVLPKGIQVTDDLGIVLAKVLPPLTEDQLKAMEEKPAVSVDQIEVEKKGKVEEEGAGGDDKKDDKKDTKK